MFNSLKTKRLMLNRTDFDQLAGYFSKLSAKGIHFVKSNMYTYSFLKGDRKKYDYFIEYNNRLKGDEREQFFEIAEKAGWERVYSDYYVHYFRASAGTATPFYTDKPSLIERYRKLINYALIFCLACLFVAWFLCGGVFVNIAKKDFLNLIFPLFLMIINLSIIIFCVKTVVHSVLKIQKLKKGL